MTDAAMFILEQITDLKTITNALVVPTRRLVKPENVYVLLRSKPKVAKALYRIDRSINYEGFSLSLDRLHTIEVSTLFEVIGVHPLAVMMLSCVKPDNALPWIFQLDAFLSHARSMAEREGKEEATEKISKLINKANKEAMSFENFLQSNEIEFVLERGDVIKEWLADFDRRGEITKVIKEIRSILIPYYLR